MKPTLIYAYDPLCGWCYGFHPVIEKISNRFDGRLNIEVKTGGLATGNRVQTIDEGYGYIKKGYKQVEETTGVAFGRNFKLLIEEGSYLYDSVPSCRAQVTVNEIAPDKAIKFAGAMQSALFVDGKSLNEIETFVELADRLGIDTGIFTKKFKDDWSLKVAEEHFDWCRSKVVTAFPTLLMKIGDELGIMARGYRPYDTVESHLHHLINNIEKLRPL